MMEQSEVWTCVVEYLAKSWCPGGLVPFDSHLRAKFVERIISNYIEPLPPPPGWNETLCEEFRKGKVWVSEQLVVAAARVADAQDGQLVN
jgi:hypothetical protein